MNNRAYFESNVMRDLQTQLADLTFQSMLDFRPLPRSYRSNWRVLHVDGFEGGRKIQMYRYTLQ